MNQNLAPGLEAKALELEASLSSDRPKNAGEEREDFKLHKLIVHGDDAATAIYLKSSGKYAAVFLFHARGVWFHSIATDSVCLGMRRFVELKENIENLNFAVSLKRATKS